MGLGWQSDDNAPGRSGGARHAARARNFVCASVDRHDVPCQQRLSAHVESHGSRIAEVTSLVSRYVFGGFMRCPEKGRRQSHI